MRYILEINTEEADAKVEAAMQKLLAELPASLVTVRTRNTEALAPSIVENWAAAAATLNEYLSEKLHD